MFYNGDSFIYSNERRLKYLCTEKTQMIDKNIKKDNICILEVRIKLSEDTWCNFRLGRYDDFFISFRYFCVVNNIPIYLFKPIMIHIIISMNKIFSLFNYSINKENQLYLSSIKKIYYSNNMNNKQKKYKIRSNNKSF